MKQKKLLLLSLIVLPLLLLTSCYSSNSFDIWNSAPGEVVLHFNGKRYTIPSGGKESLEGSDVPAGLFTYGTVYTSGVAADVSIGEGCAGEIDFSQRDVHATLEYLVTIVPADDSTGVKLDKHTLAGVLVTSANGSVPDDGGIDKPGGSE